MRPETPDKRSVSRMNGPLNERSYAVVTRGRRAKDRALLFRALGFSRGCVKNCSLQYEIYFTRLRICIYMYIIQKRGLN